ncbi:MAG: alanine--tRNA ligase [Anaerolineaceae bacterium]|nr:alanine--tRNA ligase [Anaerolineaceae bacterium]
MKEDLTGNQIRKTFIQFFVDRGHTFVPSSSLVPGGDATLLFTNAGMVQFKDVFLGTDQRPYTRAVNSQKCMRVAGKHNDLDDVGRDDWHHTFFEMLGNWSFGDYYKKEAISWAWELLTDVWQIDKSKLWVTVFKDEKEEIPTDEEAAGIWREQPGLIKDHVLYFGRKDNFWEMAETGPCGPCSEIHIDRGPDFCDRKDDKDHKCQVNGVCQRYLEIWNNVFIQYNRLDENRLVSLASTHVDTGMGFERIVSVLQNTNSNYQTDLLKPLINKVQSLTGMSDEAVFANYTAYRVIADHSRAATFLIADGVIPGNTGRNYICRMIIRRAARFAGKIGLSEPFMAQVAEVVIQNYGDAYPELQKNKKTILDNITREEERFQKTLDAGLVYLNELFEELQSNNGTILDGQKIFDLYATHGLPLELTRDIAREQGYQVDEAGFKDAMEMHRVASGAGKAFGLMGGDDVDVYRDVFEQLKEKNILDQIGVRYNPYSIEEKKVAILALFKDGMFVDQVFEGDHVELLLPETNFYIESGGQVSDTGIIEAEDNSWIVKINDVRRPAAGVIVHLGTVEKGTVQSGVIGVAKVDLDRRKAIMRNHTATHLLHAELRKVLGEHARQAGSLVAPDRLRFDFTHPEGLTQKELEMVEDGVNQKILSNYPLRKEEKKLSQAVEEGAMALFGEKYAEDVRTVQIIDHDKTLSYELCGGTHVDETADIGTFIIINEGSAAAGIRRIEAITGVRAYEVIKNRSKMVKQLSALLSAPPENIVDKVNGLRSELETERKEITRIKKEAAAAVFDTQFTDVDDINGIKVFVKVLPEADNDVLRSLTDKFREKYDIGVIVVASVINDKPLIVAAASVGAIKRGAHAGNLVRALAQMVGGGGGGKPALAQAGGKDPEKLQAALDKVPDLLNEMIK